VWKPDAYAIYKAGRTIAGLVPDAVSLRLAEGAGFAASRLNANQRAVVRRNMARVVGERNVDRYVDEAYRSYARYWIEALRLPKPGAEEIKRRTTSEGLDELAKRLDAGRSVIFVSPHVGSYDVAGAWLASHGWRVLAIAEELEPPELFDMFCEMRASVGVEILPAGKGSSARKLLSGLREGAVAGLIADRDIAGSGIEVEFFGEKTKIPNGPAVLALRTGAALAVGALFQRPGGRYHAVVLDPIDVEAGKTDENRVRALTEQTVRQMEELIRREPGQWHLFQPNWPSDPGYRHGSSSTTG
jgi:phosphatidylinositol dimannoside acyltransferase